jgi:hypothetical protein
MLRSPHAGRLAETAEDIVPPQVAGDSRFAKLAATPNARLLPMIQRQNANLSQKALRPKKGRVCVVIGTYGQILS